MSRSKREVPHFYLSTTVDVSRALDWLRGINRDRPVLERLLPTLLLYKAAACAAREVPEVNGFWLDDGFVLTRSRSPAMSTLSSIRSASWIAGATRPPPRTEMAMPRCTAVLARTRAGTLRGSELTDATITATNLGDLGVESVFGVIYPPQVALVGFGRVVERPWAVDGDLGVRPVVTMTLSADHRASDGLVGARYLRTVDRLLQHPEQL